MKSVGTMNRSLLLALACVLAFGVSDVQALTQGDRGEVYGLGESFTWKEFNDAGRQLLKESGPRFGVGLTYAHEFPGHMTLKPRIELSGGSVDYEGQIQTGVPANTTTNYFGLKLELDLGGRTRPSQSFVLEPFGGFGIRTWVRDIEDSIAADGSYAVGYAENWTTFYGRLGLRGEQYLGNMNKLFLEAGVKLPVYTENNIDDENISYESFTLEPGNKPSLFAEAGIKLQGFRISAFYDSMRFKKSPSVVVYDPYLPGYVAYHQPRSDADMFGLRIGGSF